MDTTSDRVSFPVYRIEHDDFSGRLDVRLSFMQSAPMVRHRESNTGLVNFDTMDGGLAGTITAPSGSRLGETDDGETVLILPDATIGLSARDARDAAKSSDRTHSFGIGWKSADNA